MVDISSLKQAEGDQQALVREMQDRVKSILATVSSLAGQLLPNDPLNEGFAATFMARVRAMGTAHELLSDGKWRTVSLRSLAEAALEPYIDGAKDNISLSGPEVELDARAVAALSMALHELATNAAKHGALSSKEGRLTVSWQVEQNGGDKRVVTAWSESNGPRIAELPGDGFGTDFVKRSIGYELSGTVDMSFDPGGFKASIAFPLSGNGAGGAAETTG